MIKNFTVVVRDTETRHEKVLKRDVFFTRKYTEVSRVYSLGGIEVLRKTNYLHGKLYGSLQSSILEGGGGLQSKF